MFHRPSLPPNRFWLVKQRLSPFLGRSNYVVRQKTTALRDYYRHWRRQRASLPLFHKNPQYYCISGHFQGFSRAKKRGRILRTFTGSDQNILRIERSPKRSRSKTYASPVVLVFMKMLISTSRKQISLIFQCRYCFYYFIIFFVIFIILVIIII